MVIRLICQIITFQMENSKLETLNIGSNSLLLDGIIKLKPALQQNCSLQRLGLQATNLDCQSTFSYLPKAGEISRNFVTIYCH